jgi:hypothetical protein
MTAAAAQPGRALARLQELELRLRAREAELPRERRPRPGLYVGAGTFNVTPALVLRSSARELMGLLLPSGLLAELRHGNLE